MTEMQELMESAFGHEVEVYIYGGFKPFIGKCVGYTQPLDNDPEVAVIDVEIPGRSSLCGITEEEIEKLIIKDKEE